MKRCPKCSEEKPFSEFNKDRQTPSGLATWCRVCQKAKHAARYAAKGDEMRAQAKAYAKANKDRVKANKDRVKAWNRARYIADPDKFKAQATAYAAAHPEKVKAYAHATYLRNAEHYAEKSDRRRTELLIQTPPWADWSAIKAIYREARRLTRETGIRHEVDHIYPLQHPECSGLHVPWNLQILTRSKNRSKGNTLPT